MAPIDIVIDIIKRHKTEALEQEKFYASVHSHDQCSYFDGKAHQCQDLIDEFEGIKQLFN